MDPNYRETFHANMRRILTTQFDGTASAFAHAVGTDPKTMKRWCGLAGSSVPGITDAVKISTATGWTLNRLVGLRSAVGEELQTTLAAAYHEMSVMEEALVRLLAELRAARRGAEIGSEVEVEGSVEGLVERPAPGGGRGSQEAG